MPDTLSQIIEASLLSFAKPLTIKQLQDLFDENARPDAKQIKQVLSQLQDYYHDRGVELVEVASGWRFQVRQELSHWINKLWQEKPTRYSKAFLETLALITYRQPITRGEIEDIRGVAVSSQIIKSMLEREWVKVVGQKEVLGRPNMYGTTKQFLDYFNLKKLTELPDLIALQELGFDDNESVDNTQH